MTLRSIRKKYIVFSVSFILYVLAVANGGSENMLPGTGNGNESDDERLLVEYSYYADRYDDFVKSLNLSDKETKEIKILIIKNIKAVYDGALKANNKSSGERRQSIRKTREERENNLRDFLGPDDYIAFKQYEDSIPQRNLVNSLIRSFGPDNLLDDETKEELISAMHEAMLRFESGFIPNYTDRDRPDDVPSVVYKSYLLRKEYLAAARDYLTDSQINILEEKLKRDNAAELRAYNKVRGSDKGDNNILNFPNPYNQNESKKEGTEILEIQRKFK